MKDLTETKSFCLMPWTHLQVRPNGKVYSCCLADETNPLGNFREQSLPEIWNSPKMKELRQEMLKGGAPKQCNYCYRLERDTGGSFREYANAMFKHHYEPMLAATESDGHCEKINLAYVDFRFSNLCNFRCRSCGISSSSSWLNDENGMRSPARKLREAVLGGKVVKAVKLAYKKPRQFDAALALVVPTVEEIYFAGGEPLIMDEHYRILESLIQAGRTRVRIRYNTNFSKLTHKDYDACTMWKHFPNVVVQASLDGSHERGEYMRKGQNWARTVANRERLARECPHVRFEVSATISNLNVWHIPDFFREWVELGYIAEDRFFLNPLYGPEPMRMQLLPPPFKKQVIEKYERHVNEFVTHPDAKARFLRVVEMLKAEDESKHFGRFLKWNGRLDALRSESYKSVFPELSELRP